MVKFSQRKTPHIARFFPVLAEREGYAKICTAPSQVDEGGPLALLTAWGGHPYAALSSERSIMLDSSLYSQPLLPTW